MINRSPRELAMSMTDEELMDVRYTLGGTDGLLARLEYDRRLKNSILELKKSTDKSNKKMIILTWAIVVLTFFLIIFEVTRLFIHT